MARTLRFMLVLAASAILAHSASVTAVAITINNFSFESPALSEGSWSNGADAVPGWGLAYGAQTDGVQAYTTAQYYSIPNGTQALYDNYNGAQNGVYQDVGALQADTTYKLTVYVGERLDGYGNGGYAGVSLINGTDYHGAPLAFNYLVPSSMTPGYFQPLSLSYTTGSSVSGDLTVYLNQYLQSPFTGNTQVSFDNVTLDAASAINVASPVPDTSTWIMLAAGMAATLWLVRRRPCGMNFS